MQQHLPGNSTKILPAPSNTKYKNALLFHNRLLSMLGAPCFDAAASSRAASTPVSSKLPIKVLKLILARK